MFTLPPTSSPDWAHAREPRLALRTLQAEWVQDVASTLHEGFWFPQVQFAYQGLLAMHQGENWKFLDGLGFAVYTGDEPIALTPEPVSVDPLVVTYRYGSRLGSWELRYALLPQSTEEGALLELRIRPPQGVEACEIRLRPVLDIRHMYAPSDPEKHVSSVSGSLLTVSQTYSFAMQAPGRFVSQQNVLSREYALGSGFREDSPAGVRFIAEARDCFVPGEWVLPVSGESTVLMATGRNPQDAARVLEQHEACQSRFDDEVQGLRDIREWTLTTCPDWASQGLAERVFVMAHKFGMRVDGTRIPEAGGWWFRTPWFRDVFEGLLANHRTLTALGLGHRITEVLELALKLQDPKTGRIPNRLPERQGPMGEEFFHATDATTLLFTLLDELPSSLTETLRDRAREAFRKAVQAFQTSDPAAVDGTAVLGQGGILYCVPWHSWTDGKRVIDYEGRRLEGLPLRVSKAWQLEALLAGKSPEAVLMDNLLPQYALPEINAQWIRMLAWGARHAMPGAAEMRDQARGSFRRLFWDGHRMANLVTLDGRTDWTSGSPAMVAAALLGEDVFTRDELRRAWEGWSASLSVKRNGKLFGFLVKDSDERIYYGDNQYHEAVCWPRDTAYMLRLLALLGDDGTAAEVLAANLDHQQSEAVLFYNQELFSLAEGLNPSPGLSSGNPVPVKNPLQYWSQWCDAFLPVDR